MKSPIVLTAVSKSYGQTRVVKSVSFSVQKGKIFGLIGPDGAGKTTIMRMVVSLLSPDSGSVVFMDKSVKDDPAFVRKNIGYMPQRFSLYQDLTVQENLMFFAELFGVRAAERDSKMQELYAFSGLARFRNRRAGALSGGMKQKLALSCMLVHEPASIVLDEPTTGVDPVARNELWDILHRQADKGVAILVSTPYMEEAMQCDQVGLIYNGEILAIDEPREVIKKHKKTIYLLKTKSQASTFEKLYATEFSGHIELFGEGLHITDELQAGQVNLEHKVRQYGIEFEGLQRIEPSFEDVFLDLMKRAVHA